MAILPVHQMNQQPNFLATGINARRAGQQDREYQQQQEDRNALRSLAPNILRGDVGAFEQAAAINPQAATQYQDAGDGMAKRVRGAAKYMQQALQSENPAQVQGAWQAVRPFLERATGKQGPEQWDPAYAQGLEQVLAQTAYLEGAGSGVGVQSTFVDESGNRVAIMRDGSTQVLGRNNPNIRVLEQEGALPYGVVTSGGQAGSVVPLGQGGGGQAQVPQGQGARQILPQGGGQAAVDQIAASANQMIAAGVPEAQVEAWAASQMGGGQVSQGIPSAPQAPVQAPQQSGQLPPRLDYQGGGQVGPVRIPTAGERAAATEAAQQQVRMQYAPAMQQIETQGAIDRERGVGQVKADAERAEQAPKRIASYRQALTAASNVQQSIDNALSMISPLSTGFVGARSRGIEGSPAFNLNSEIETVRANLGFDRLQQMRDNSPTGGALGQVAVQELTALQSTVANLDPDQSAEQIRANLNRVKTHYDNWTAAVDQALQEQMRQPAPAPGGSSGGVLRYNPATGDFE